MIPKITQMYVMEASQMEEMIGVNYWEFSFYDEVAGNDECYLKVRLDDAYLEDMENEFADEQYDDEEWRRNMANAISFIKEMRKLGYRDAILIHFNY